MTKPRKVESPSSLGKFIKCPYLYDSSYIHVIRSVSSVVADFGKEVHKALELELGPERRIGTYSPVIMSYIDAVHEWLTENNEDIVAVEQKFEGFFINGQEFQIIVDAITKSGIAIDYKITGAPSYYKSNVSYQMKIQTLAFEQLGLDLRPMFLLLERDKKTNKFKGLTEEVVVTSDLQLEEVKLEIIEYMNMLKSCQTSGIFPPSYNGCSKCFSKKSCKFYSGW